MKFKLTLWVDDDQQRILTQSLHLYQEKLIDAITSTDFQRMIVQDELGMVAELLHKVEEQQKLIALPTILRTTQKDFTEDWKENFCRLQKGLTEAIHACSDEGEDVEVRYDPSDKAFCIMIDGELQLKNQSMPLVLRRFKSMVGNQ